MVTPDAHNEPSALNTQLPPNQALKTSAFSIPEATEASVAAILTTLTGTGQTLSTAESLTAGLLSATITSVSGASAVFRGAVVTYATDVKHLLADVDNEILDQHGPVAEETARAMAWGVRQRVQSQWAVSLTVVAGPNPQDGHEVGEVWCGICTPRAASVDEVLVRRFNFEPVLGRNGIRGATVHEALAWLEQLVKQYHQD